MELNRLKHIEVVAQLMKNLAPELGLDEYEMYVLGFVHDVGYEINIHAHAEAGAQILEDDGYKYAYAVKSHGSPFADFNDPVVWLLNYCDMSIDGKGQLVFFKRRLKDIKERHGENSEAYKNSKLVIEKLKENYKLKAMVTLDEELES